MGASRIVFDPNDHYRNLCMVTGHMFLCFAGLETLLTGILKLHMSYNISDDESSTASISLASAVYGGMRFTQSRDVIKRILVVEAAPAQKVEYLSKIFEHVGLLQSLRDKLAHQSLTPVSDEFDGKWQISTQFTTKDLAKTEFWIFEADAVQAAATDLITAQAALGRRHATNCLIDCLVDDLSPITWQYKPAMLERRATGKLPIPQAPVRPPQS